MRREGRKRLGILLILAGATVPLMIASVSYACANLAVLNLSTANARPGAQVTATGRNFAAPTSRRCPCTPVVLRLDKRGTGRVLGQAQPDSEGKFRYSFAAPQVGAGPHVVLGEQTRADGRPASGTPARAPLRLGYGGKASRSEVVGGWAPSKPDGGAPTADAVGASAGPSLPADMVAVLLSAALSGSGLALLLSARRRRRGVPVA